MTAAELIARLQKVPGETPVCVADNLWATEPLIRQGHVDLSESGQVFDVMQPAVFIESHGVVGRDADVEPGERVPARELIRFFVWREAQRRARELAREDEAGKKLLAVMDVKEDSPISPTTETYQSAGED